jgi:DNA repair protein RecO (recombination protein O)
MNWRDEGYLLSKRNFDENSIIIECFTYFHGKYSGIVYGGSSKKKKMIFQVGNKILLNYKSKNQNKIGYFSTELIHPVSAKYFDDKKRSICILSAASILKILLPEGQANKKVYSLFENLLNQLNLVNWIKFYIYWEIAIVNELGFEIDFKSMNNKKLTANTIEINDKIFNLPKLLIEKDIKRVTKHDVKQALNFNKSLLIENFILPNRLRFPLSRNILEKYYS